MKYFQDLSEEQQEAIWQGLKNDKELKQEAEDEGLVCDDEYIDDYINRLNTSENVEEWLKIYWFENY